MYNYYHEIAHAVYGTEHNESCPLMQSKLDTILNKADCFKHLIKYQTNKIDNRIAIG